MHVVEDRLSSDQVELRVSLLAVGGRGRRGQKVTPSRREAPQVIPPVCVADPRVVAVPTLLGIVGKDRDTRERLAVGAVDVPGHAALGPGQVDRAGLAGQAGTDRDPRGLRVAEIGRPARSGRLRHDGPGPARDAGEVVVPVRIGGGWRGAASSGAGREADPDGRRVTSRVLVDELPTDGAGAVGSRGHRGRDHRAKHNHSSSDQGEGMLPHWRRSIAANPDEKHPPWHSCFALAAPFAAASRRSTSAVRRAAARWR